MIDIETLDTKSTALILSIGAVEFDKYSNRIGDTLYLEVDIDSCLAAQRTVTKNTLKWWMQQSTKAKEVFSSLEPHSLERSLRILSGFVSTVKSPELCGPEIWANGVVFDISILESSYVACGLQPQWDFRNIRCLRTLKALPGATEIAKRVKLEGEAHNALDDAIYQARVVQQIYKEMYNVGKR